MLDHRYSNPRKWRVEWWSLEAAGRSWVNGRKFLLCNKVVLLGASRIVVSPHLQEMSSSLSSHIHTNL